MSKIRSFAFIAIFAFAGCAMPSPEDTGSSADALQGGRACTSSDACSDGSYCTVEDGDCFSNCSPNQICPAVCWGVCTRDDREVCGSVTCGAGQVCCNASCGICTEPDGVCTQQLCDSTSL